MNPFSRWRQRRSVANDLADEMAEHLAEKIEDFRERGLGEDEARRIALREFGNAALFREDSRAAWGWNAAEQVAQDVRFGWRVSWKTPGTTITAIAVLALGIGMNTAMFSAVKAVLLSSLPYPEPERMVRLEQTNRTMVRSRVSGLDFRDWRAQNRTFAAMATYSSGEITLSGEFSPRRARMAPVGEDFFGVVKTPAAVGRTFRKEEQTPGGPATLVFGYEFAQAVFGEAPRAIGKTVRLNGLAFNIIGVMPPKFDFPDRTQIWVPNDLFPDTTTRSAHNYRVLGRIKQGVSLHEAQADMDVVAANLARQYVDDKDQGIRVTSLYESLVGGVRPALLVLLGAVATVLLIACVNISNLQLARAAARQKEMSMRRALGAGRGRLVRQLLTESLLLSVAGGGVGLLLASLGVRVLRAIAPANIPRLQGLTVDGEMLAFTAVVALAAGMLFGTLPAIESASQDVNDALKQGAGKGEDRSRKRRGQLLVTAQVALATLLLSVSALLIGSYWKLAHGETGLTTAGLYQADVDWPAGMDGASTDPQFVRVAASRILEGVKALPGVSEAAFVRSLPFQGAPDGGFEIEGRPLPSDPHAGPDAEYRTATAGFFPAFHVPILKGRNFTADDERSTQQVAIVNQLFEDKFFPGGSALGQRIRFFGFDPHPKEFMTIVGVVPTMRTADVHEEPTAEVYANYFQHLEAVMSSSLVVRGRVAHQRRIEKIITTANRSTAVEFESMDGVIARSVARERFQTTLLSVFAGCALLLAVVGVYGVLSYTVTRRTSEFGVRMALGATANGIIKLVVGEGAVPVAAGLGGGLLGAWMSARLVRTMLFSVKENEPIAVAAAVACFVAAAFLACYIPALRASRVDPTQALRAE